MTSTDFKKTFVLSIFIVATWFEFNKLIRQQYHKLAGYYRSSLTGLLELNIVVLGNIIKFHCRQSGLSQLKLADFAGVGKTDIYDLEKGKMTVRFNTLTKFLKVLNIKTIFETPLMSSFEASIHEKS